ncbi:MAG: DUF72 domain-containing protein [Nitratireductor sp.]|nr:DUF72 domain-containing protein [Nitratireductor sp.]
MPETGTIRAGIGGWTFDPWNASFYPEKLARKKQLEYASRALPTIEINGTYYRDQKPATFAGWAAQVPEGFVFSVKANRFTTVKKVLGESGESVSRFIASGITELGPHLGPILWQFAPTKKFDAQDFAAWLSLLPDSHAGVKLRHALEVRHESFVTPEFVALARKHGAAIVYAHHQTYPEIADATADFVYARLQRGNDANETCYASADMDRWAARARQWAEGDAPDGLPYAAENAPSNRMPRDVFVYFIHEGKVRAPHGAMELMRRVG